MKTVTKNRRAQKSPQTDVVKNLHEVSHEKLTSPWHHAMMSLPWPRTSWWCHVMMWHDVMSNQDVWSQPRDLIAWCNISICPDRSRQILVFISIIPGFYQHDQANVIFSITRNSPKISKSRLAARLLLTGTLQRNSDVQPSQCLWGSQKPSLWTREIFSRRNSQYFAAVPVELQFEHVAFSHLPCVWLQYVSCLPRRLLFPCPARLHLRI